MSRGKTSQAVIKTARLNPINKEEKQALAYIEDLEAKGYNFKQIIVDAINQRMGATPELFAPDRRDQATRFAGLVEAIIADFANELLSKINAGDIKVPASAAEDEERPDGVTAFTRNFARGILQRQQQIHGDDED